MDAVSQKKMISIVVPAFNEEANLEMFYDQVSAELEKLDYLWEIVIVDDGSRDDSLSVLEKLHHRDSRLHAISFSRNFGNQMAITAGLEAAQGDVIVVMDADLQQPPEIIPKLLAYWEQGYHVVNTIRNYGEEIGWFKKFTSFAFYKVMNMLSDVKIQPGVSDFRLMDRRIVNILNNMPEHSRFIRAQIAWLGFKQITIPYNCRERNAGVPSFSPVKLIALALDGIFSFSSKPLRWIAFLGVFLMSSLLPYGFWAVFQFFVFGPKTPGWTSLVVLNLFIGGAILFSLGLLGEYVARIYEEVKHRPRYLVKKRFGFSDSEQGEEFDQKENSEQPSERYFHVFPPNHDFGNRKIPM
ncbi:MAG: glycosyltransferase family 2 protein [Planctomycetia bacterium]|nr:glycosyltransferase family 2 protein [Planctomycetia bacterium]